MISRIIRRQGTAALKNNIKSSTVGFTCPSQQASQRMRKAFHQETNAKVQVATKDEVSTQTIIETEEKYSAHNYHPLPVVFSKASGVDVWDPEGNHYYDFLSAYSAVNQGHCHPRIVNALVEQAQRLTLSSRAFHNDKFGPWAKFVTNYFGYERVLPMNTGAEAVETALKLARKWGYEKKKIPDGKAIIIAAEDNFHGRTLAIISMSTSPETVEHFGPFLPGVVKIPYNDTAALEKVLNEHGKNVCGLLLEPIQGEAGVNVPTEGYLKKCQDLCKKHNVLLLADEIQTGIGRTGKLLCSEWDGIKPDVVILGKALGGGVFPISCILANNDTMDVFTPGTHGSTFGGNPLGCAVSTAALEVIRDEKLTENAQRLGEIFRAEMKKLVGGIVKEVRGRGLLNAIVIDDQHPKMKGLSAYQLCKKMAKRGLLAKQTHDVVIRFAPPLVITEAQLRECISIITSVVKEVEA